MSWQTGLSFEHERWLSAHVGRGSPLFVTDYPLHIKPFYMLPSAINTAACFDLLLPDGTELVGGSLREHRLDPLVDKLSKLALSGRSNLDWYLDLRRYGSMPHGGFGLGFDRLIGYLAGVGNIKDVVAWPRYFGRCDG